MGNLKYGAGGAGGRPPRRNGDSRPASDGSVLAYQMPRTRGAVAANSAAATVSALTRSMVRTTSPRTGWSGRFWARHRMPTRGRSLLLQDRRNLFASTASGGAALGLGR